MSIKGDVIAVALAGAVLLAAGWYAKKKLQGAVAGAGGIVKDVWESAANGVSIVFNGVGEAFVPERDNPVREVINAPVHFIDGYVNAAGQWITGDDNWNQASWMHRLDEDFGIIDPSEGW